MVKLQNIKFRYNDEEVILNNASLEIEKGKISVVLGRNGIGKTTLLSLIDGFLTQDSGTISKEEESVYIYDNPYLYEHLTANEYIDLISSISKNSINQELVNQLVTDFNLESSLNKLISSYSLGMKHKLALLTALMLDYKLFLIDEPLAALDPDSQSYMIDLFKSMKHSSTSIIISTHMLNVAYSLADEIIMFNNKQLSKIENNFNTYEEFEKFVVDSIRED